jgi:hypothetical protein
VDKLKNYKNMTITEQHRLWLDSEPTRNTRIGASGGAAGHWEGVKMLGTGGNGIVGLWKWKTPIAPPQVNHVAVKQQLDYGHLCQQEVKWMRRFQDRGEHTVMCYVMSDLKEKGGGN